jgi:DNA-binding response OmpR family regulator
MPTLESFSHTETPPRPASAGPPPSAPPAATRAFVVGHDSGTRRAFGELLGISYEVQSFESGEAALEALTQAWPDVVLLDAGLAGLGCVELCRRMKASAAGRPLAVLLVTDRRASEGRALAEAAGADDFLPRPLAPQELRDRADTLARLVWHQRQHALDAARVDALEAQLAEAQRLAILGTFARNIGHEMNNVGTVLKSALEELSRSRTLDAEVLEELQLATSQLAGLAGAVQRLAAPPASPVVLDVRTVVRDVVSMARLTGRTKYVVVEVDLPAAPVVARLPAADAQQLVLGLLIGAADAVAQLPSGQVHLTLRDEHGSVCLWVEDNAPEVSGRTGLDAPRRLVVAWGGSLELSRRPGSGARVEARFPSDRS